MIVIKNWHQASNRQTYQPHQQMPQGIDANHSSYPMDSDLFPQMPTPTASCKWHVNDNTHNMLFMNCTLTSKPAQVAIPVCLRRVQGWMSGGVLCVVWDRGGVLHWWRSHPAPSSSPWRRHSQTGAWKWRACIHHPWNISLLLVTMTVFPNKSYHICVPADRHNKLH